MSKRKPAAQGAEPTYELHTLGWKAFQQLCVSVVSDLWGQTVEGYWDSNDGGRDGAFYGRWQPTDSELFEGSFTVQCKFSATPGGTLRLQELNDEFEKATRLAQKGLADNYFLLSSKRLTGAMTEKIEAKFESIPGIKKCAVYGADRISHFIRESPRLRRLVPHVYGLGDLSQILDERAYEQAQEILSALGDDLAKFVVTDAYRSAARAVSEHGFVMLLGEPACGKSTIAAALALGALDDRGCATVKVRDADDFVTHSNPHEPRQFFWVDDAFGATQFDWQGAVEWSQTFPHIHAAIRRGARVVFTSRSYIFHSARRVLKSSALPVLNESQVVIRVEELSNAEREQILYNHIRLGAQPKAFKTRLKPHLSAVAASKGFSPEIARRLGNPAFTAKLHISKTDLTHFVSEPMVFLQEVLRTLDDHSRSAIALIFMRGGVLESPVSLSQSEEHAVSLLGGSSAEVRNALNALDGSLVNQVRQEGNMSWRFKHPTIRDAFAALVAENHELMDIYLAGTPAAKLFGEISCGDVGLDGVKVIVPQSRYDTVLDRLEEYIDGNREHGNTVHYFLARRCDKAFLLAFLGRRPSFLSSLNVGAYLYAVSDVGIIVRLNEFDLLPEPERQRHVSAIRELAVRIPDSGFLSVGVKSLLTEEETGDILSDVRLELLPELRQHIADWRGNWDKEEDPDSYFDELKDALIQYKEILSEDEDAVGLIEEGLEIISEAAAEMTLLIDEPPDQDRDIDPFSEDVETVSSRSIFDDVDQ